MDGDPAHDRPDDIPDDIDAPDVVADDEDLLSALEVIEDQPLAQRAAGYAALHDELTRRLDDGSPPQGGA